MYLTNSPTLRIFSFASATLVKKHNKINPGKPLLFFRNEILQQCSLKPNSKLSRIGSYTHCQTIPGFILRHEIHI